MKSIIAAYMNMRPEVVLEEVKNDHRTFAQSYYKSVLTEENLNSVDILMEDRIDFIKNALKDKPISTEHDPMADHKDNESIINHIASVDPSKKKVYTQWMVNQYRKGSFKQEDAYRVGDNLAKFDSRKNEFEHKDIAKHTPDTLNDAVKSLKSEAPKSKAAITKDIEQKGRTHLYEDDKIKVYKLENTPEGKQASKDIYGGGSEIGGTHTGWCTADRRPEHNRFDVYNEKGPLYVVHEKREGDHDIVHQMHLHSGSFMDKDDYRITHESFGRIKDSLHKAFDAHPEMLAPHTK